jgi:glycosyltransferase involved in cell wall biosynthesis
MSKNNSQIAFIIPCYNEEITIAKVVKDAKSVIPEAIVYVFDNNSRDKTAEEAKTAGAIVVTSPEQGKGNVVRHMFQFVDADTYIMIDGDDTYDLIHLPEMLKKYRDNNIDMFVGTRLKTYDETSVRAFHKMGNDLVVGLVSTFFKTGFSDVMSGFRIFSRDFVKSIPLCAKGFEVETELTLQAINKGFRVQEYEISYSDRPKGSFSKLNTYRDGIKVIFLFILLLRNYRPFAFYGFIAFILASLSLLIGSFPVIEYYHTSYIKRVPLAILASGVGILSIISLAIGLILDNMSRYHQELFQQIRKSR